jgi:hypothetical protein
VQQPCHKSFLHSKKTFETVHTCDSMTLVVSVLCLCSCLCVDSLIPQQVHTGTTYKEGTAQRLVLALVDKCSDLHSNQLRGRQWRCMQPRCSWLLAVVTSANPVFPSTSNCRLVSFAIAYIQLCSEQPRFRGAPSSQQLVQS